ncbi:Rossmann-fold NAD(P)-binding domain-containing protein [Bryocella elongata]|uniref:hypothetical protein n=1 Tax=Bryocella elongata TaxID=863522 RepID=UPI000CDF146C|nr:hypothetical protein [Bryocella elongata]
MVSPDDLAQQFGEVLGKEVRAQAIPRDAWVRNLAGMGIPERDTWAFEEMAESINSGWIGFGVEGTKRVDATMNAKQ